MSTSRWTVEYRPEVKQWEVMEGAGHRGLYPTREKAYASIPCEDLIGSALSNGALNTIIGVIGKAERKP